MTMVCPTCGGRILGDGFQTPAHCEHADAQGVEPDAGPVWCESEDEVRGTRERLKCCPFCGPGLSIVTVQQDDHYYRIRCGACGMSSGTLPIKAERSLERMIEHWNRKRYCFYTAHGSNGSCSHSYKEGEVVRTLALSFRYTSAQLDAMEVA